MHRSMFTRKTRFKPAKTGTVSAKMELWKRLGRQNFQLSKHLKIERLLFPRGWFLITPYPKITWKFPKARDTLSVITRPSIKWLKILQCNLLLPNIIFSNPQICIGLFSNEKLDWSQRIHAPFPLKWSYESDLGGKIFSLASTWRYQSFNFQGVDF